jgi:hypothetical protein
MADKTFDEVRSDKTDDAAPDQGQVSEGPSGLGTSETSVGGADSVPGTPDALPYHPSETEPDAKPRKNVKDGSGDGLNEV